MEIIGCGKGHYYNPSEYSSCPECAKAAGMESIDVTIPVEQAEGMFADNFDVYPANRSEDRMVTEPIDHWRNKQTEYNPAEHVDTRTTDWTFETGKKTIPIDGKISGRVESYNATMPVDPITPPETPGGTPSRKIFSPAVGWLVCVEGPSRGMDYRVHSQYNYIGRARHMDFCIPGDEHISAEKAAIIAYDDVEKIFLFGPGTGHNIVRVNGKMAIGPVQLSAYDELTIGKTKLLFIPFCGERFDWNEK